MAEIKEKPKAKLMAEAIEEIKKDRSPETGKDMHMKGYIKNYVAFMKSSRKDKARAEQFAERASLTADEKKELESLI